MAKRTRRLSFCDCSWAFIGLALAGCTSSHAAAGAADTGTPLADGSQPEASGVDGSLSDAKTAADGADSGDGGGCGVPASFQWSSSGPLLAPVSDATHNLIAVKDPSVVYYNGKWHVFVSTVAVGGIYSMAYIAFTDWNSTSSASFYYLSNTPGLAGYTAAPQIFYFMPRKQWFLVFQSGPPMYSTNSDIGNPAGWTQATPFFSGVPASVQNDTGGATWLDFKVICDSANCYLFFSADNGNFYRSQTSIASFPSGFSDPVVVMSGPNAGELFEASNIYSMKGTGKYLALIEAFDAASNYHRFYKSWTADALDGTWTPLQDTFAAPFASTANTTFPGGQWTNDISHGEMIRDGYDETQTIDTCNLRYVYQGTDPSAPNDAGYNGIPWRVGLLTKTN